MKTTCEMCGIEVPRTKLVMVEGAAVQVCGKCERFASSPAVKTKEGVVLLPDVAERLDTREKRRKERDIYEKAGEPELAMDYHERIRLGRQKLGMSQEELGKLINERKSVIIQVEKGEMTPTDSLVHKLEKTLNITLKEVMEDTGEIKKADNSRGLTLGDFIKVKEKKN
jgi:putative transcription factor